MSGEEEEEAGGRKRRIGGWEGGGGGGLRMDAKASAGSMSVQSPPGRFAEPRLPTERDSRGRTGEAEQAKQNTGPVHVSACSINTPSTVTHNTQNATQE